METDTDNETYLLEQLVCHIICILPELCLLFIAGARMAEKYGSQITQVIQLAQQPVSPAAVAAAVTDKPVVTKAWCVCVRVHCVCVYGHTSCLTALTSRTLHPSQDLSPIAPELILPFFIVSLNI